MRQPLELGADHELLDVGLQQGGEVDVAGVLAGHDHGVQAHRLVAVVLDRHLGLAVGAQVRDGAVLAHAGEAPGQPVGQHDRQRHELGGVVAGVAEHQALVAGALAVERVAQLPSARSSKASSTPWAMSGDCAPIETETPHDCPSKPFLEES